VSEVFGDVQNRSGATEPTRVLETAVSFLSVLFRVISWIAYYAPTKAIHEITRTNTNEVWPVAALLVPYLIAFRIYSCNMIATKLTSFANYGSHETELYCVRGVEQ
jgi:hypothetical protein